MKPNILVTGGAGYIGSHTCVRLIEAGYHPVVLDNFSNSHPRVMDRIEALTGLAPTLVAGDVRDGALLQQVLARHELHAAIHFAGLKAVGESVAKPLDYYDVNVQGTLCLLRALDAAGVRKLVFSSSATVYGEPSELPLTEQADLGPTSPYGQTKLVAERAIAETAASRPDWATVSLRYFNPVGAHPSGTMGEDPRGVPNNLMPYIAQVAVGRREALQVFGADYPTPDGTGVRDYIHVLDLADGHVAALRHLDAQPGAHCFNLGTGEGQSVLQLKAAFEQACGKPLPHRVVARRAGDVAAYWADPARARQTLGWQARRDLGQMCSDTWRWQQSHPNGYAG
ncbi:UDP-glucose 4-epimerase GalE [Ideonella sp.]|uniref:UDP-glucose 4-epimerase GalE n=1 Tax=Ideonella sp. TaxID=1929293 RepID=UPI003BB51C66